MRQKAEKELRDVPLKAIRNGFTKIGKTARDFNKFYNEHPEKSSLVFASEDSVAELAQKAFEAIEEILNEMKIITNSAKRVGLKNLTKTVDVAVLEKRDSLEKYKEALGSGVNKALAISIIETLVKDLEFISLSKRRK